MKNILRQPDGFYHVANKKYKQLEGSRAAVMHETAYKTSGGLTMCNLVYSHGRIVSKNKSISAKKNNRLKEHGWTHKKGSFGAVKIDNKSRKNRKNKK